MEDCSILQDAVAALKARGVAQKDIDAMWVEAIKEEPPAPPRTIQDAIQSRGRA